MKHLKTAVSVLTLCALAGCAVGPDFKQPAAPTTSRITNQPLPAETVSAGTNGGGQRAFAPQGATVPADWWTLFSSPVLGGLGAATRFPPIPIWRRHAPPCAWPTPMPRLSGRRFSPA